MDEMVVKPEGRSGFVRCSGDAAGVCVQKSDDTFRPIGLDSSRMGEKFREQPMNRSDGLTAMA
ncbi:MAG: hypothetical protein DDG58_02155 [Ardenticatenia bacterium]|jgi:hypothetical protein|nr:MAG: hypothetical protein DDG58_02155 [Ardenticatenia bacterium]